jgi:hypothetical protein
MDRVRTSQVQGQFSVGPDGRTFFVASTQIPIPNQWGHTNRPAALFYAFTGNEIADMKLFMSGPGDCAEQDWPGAILSATIRELGAPGGAPERGPYSEVIYGQPYSGEQTTYAFSRPGEVRTIRVFNAAQANAFGALKQCFLLVQYEPGR